MICEDDCKFIDRDNDNDECYLSFFHKVNKK